MAARGGISARDSSASAARRDEGPGAGCSKAVPYRAAASGINGAAPVWQRQTRRRAGVAKHARWHLGQKDRRGAVDPGPDDRLARLQPCSSASPARSGARRCDPQRCACHPACDRAGTACGDEPDRSTVTGHYPRISRRLAGGVAPCSGHCGCPGCSSASRRGGRTLYCFAPKPLGCALKKAREDAAVNLGQGVDVSQRDCFV